MQDGARAPDGRELRLKLWLASGITTVRDVGSDFVKSKALRERSAAGSVAAPRLFLYPMFGRQKDAGRPPWRACGELKDSGADGIKFWASGAT